MTTTIDHGFESDVGRLRTLAAAAGLRRLRDGEHSVTAMDVTSHAAQQRDGDTSHRRH